MSMTDREKLVALEAKCEQLLIAGISVYMLNIVPGYKPPFEKTKDLTNIFQI